jgi:hydroxymethylpyrimidine/phosphomethylpyrimidine kinase
MTTTTRAIALTIAGSDSGGGAGIQADLKTFVRYGVYGTSVITAITAQNTLGVRAWERVSPALVGAQLDAVAEDLRPAAIKSGMLGDADVVQVVAERIARHRLTPYVLDPVMAAASGESRGSPDVAAMERAARALVSQLGATAALVKGGHLAGDELVDVFFDGQAIHRFTHPRVATTSTHGTGCTLSAAIAASLALGRPLLEAVEDGLAYVARAIASAPGLGAGHGPLDHFA